MKQLFLLITISIIGLTTACKNEVKIEEPLVLEAAVDTLAYEMNRIFRTEADCVESDDKDCAKIEINYITFLEAPSDSVLQKLNMNLLDELRGEGYTNVVAYANGFIRDFVNDKAEIPNMATWNAEIDQKVRFNTPDFVCIETNQFTFTGGTHGIYGTSYENYDRNTGDLIQLTDLFAPSFERPLIDLGEKHFRQSMAIAASESFDQTGYTFPKDQFYLPKNFGLTQEGITFLYNIYEIAPYSKGVQEFTIPYGELKALLKKDSILL
ncbi:MAG: DUF3298 domain-containing protein [Bacteroidota bacterium]